MCKTVEANRTAVLSAYRNGSESSRETLQILFGKDLFSEKITDVVKTFEDALAVTGEDWCPPKGMTADEIAYRKLKIIAKALNEGWTPDWANSNQRKYMVYLTDYTAGVGFSATDYDLWFTGSVCGSRLCYASSELAMYAGTQFRDLYNQFFN